MTYVYQGHIEKIPILKEIMANARISKDEIAYIGDDFTDIVIMHRVGFAIATGNAHDGSSARRTTLPKRSGAKALSARWLSYC